MIDIILKPLKPFLRLIFIKSKTKKEEVEILKIEDIYTPLSVAKEEIWRRWNDKELRKKVEDFLGGDISKFFNDSPKAILGRHIATPNKELFRFLDVTEISELPVAVIEYLEDTFTSRNSLKYHLCKMYFHGGIGKKGGDKLTSENIVAFDCIEGKNLNQLKTIWNQDLVEFHHDILRLNCPQIELIDISNRLNNLNDDINDFYLKYLTIFTVFGILFENYVNKDNEKELIQKIVIPTIEKIKKKFGVKPLIVPLLPIDDEDNLYWQFYSQDLEKNIKQKIYGI